MNENHYFVCITAIIVSGILALSLGCIYLTNTETKLFVEHGYTQMVVGQSVHWVKEK